MGRSKDTGAEQKIGRGRSHAQRGNPTPHGNGHRRLRQLADARAYPAVLAAEHPDQIPREDLGVQRLQGLAFRVRDQDPQPLVLGECEGPAQVGGAPNTQVLEGPGTRTQSPRIDGWRPTLLQQQPARSGRLGTARDRAQVAHIGHPIQRDQEMRPLSQEQRLEGLLGEGLRSRSDPGTPSPVPAHGYAALTSQGLQLANTRASTVGRQHDFVHCATARSDRLDNGAYALDPCGPSRLSLHAPTLAVSRAAESCCFARGESASACTPRRRSGLPMPRLTQREIPQARPPHELLGWLGPGARALEACGPYGWGTAPGGRGAGHQLLALEPALEFRGGLEALDEARSWLAGWRADEPLAALLIGWLSYDLGRAFEALPALAREELPTPPVCLAGFRAVYRYDRARRIGAVLGGDAQAVARLAERVREACEQARPRPLPALPVPRLRSSDQAFREGIRAIQRWIRAGDVYQVNLSRRLDLEPVAAADLPFLYGRLTQRFGAPFSAYLDCGDTVVVSNSPERLLRVVGDRIETCPIKGTRPRGRTAEEDAWLAKDLLHSSKDHAEHLMIVDLERNDLGRVCHTGTVEVRRMAELQRLPTVFHLVSSIQGQLRDPSDWTALLRATFPGGSITGAPKLRAMEIIEVLEPVRRGIYTGALGYFDAAGGVDLSIAIRTAIARDGALHLHLGGGIVADSIAEAELEETRDKGRAFAELWGHSI